MEKEKLFTIEQLAKATGISRASLLRLETDGLITPRARGGRGNSRFYSSDTALKVLKLVSYRGLGFATKDAMELIRGNDYREMLDIMSRKLAVLNGIVEELKSNLDESSRGEIRETTSAAGYYFIEKRILSNTFRDISPEIMNLLGEAVRKGFRLDSGTPGMIQFRDDGETREQEFTLMIHIDPSCKDKPGVVEVPEERILYMNSFGKIRNIRPFLQQMEKEAEKRGYRSCLPFRIIPTNIPFATPGKNTSDMVMRLELVVR